jgi:hypothetical protein
MFSDKTAKFLLLAALVICVGGAFAPNWIVNQFMFGFSRALAILGLMVLWRTGLVSFGHAFYFGLGAYAVAILDSKLGVSDVFLRLMAGAVVAGFAGFLIGFIHAKLQRHFLRNAQHSDIDGALWHCGEKLNPWDRQMASQSLRRPYLGFVPETKYPLFVIITLVGLIAALSVNFYPENDLRKTNHCDQRQRDKS